MAIYRHKTTGDLIDAWMHGKDEDMFTVAFPNWVHALWEAGGAYTSEDGVDFLKTAAGGVEIPDGHYIVRSFGGDVSVMTPETIAADYLYEA